MSPETRLEGIQWVPHRQSRTKHDDDRPLLWVTRAASRDPNDGSTLLFLVNDTGETLRSVIVEGFGFVTVDDEVSSVGGPKATYTDVPPGAAVKVDAYDDFYDLDYMIGFSAIVEGITFGPRTFSALPQKGGLGEEVLWWASERDSGGQKQ